MNLESFNKKLNQLDFLNDKSNKNISNTSSENNFSSEDINESKEKVNIKNKSNSINTILILDTETTGLDENKDELVEIGGILFNIPSRSVLSQVSFLLPVQSNNAEHINGIAAEISNLEQPWQDGLNFFLKMVDCCDFVVAHNVEFDKKWFGKGKLPEISKKWVCSLDDINWSFKKTLKNRPSVTDLALSFQIPVWNLHRALSDCYYLAEVFKKCENLEDIFLKAIEPRFLYKAIVSYEQRLLAKNAGFLWNVLIEGAWAKKLTTSEASKLDFKVQIINSYE